MSKGTTGSANGGLNLGVNWSGGHKVVEGTEFAASVESWRGYAEAPQSLIGEGIWVEEG